MNLVTVREIYRSREAYLDKEIQIGGWVRSVRGSKAFGFVVVSDGSYFETHALVSEKPAFIGWFFNCIFG